MRGADTMTADKGIASLWKKEDWWCVWLGLGIIVCAIVFLLTGSTLGPLAVSPPQDWTALSSVTAHFAERWVWYVPLFVALGAIFTISTSIMGHKASRFLPGFALIYLASVLILVVSQSRFFHT